LISDNSTKSSLGIPDCTLNSKSVDDIQLNLENRNLSDSILSSHNKISKENTQTQIDLYPKESQILSYENSVEFLGKGILENGQSEKLESSIDLVGKYKLTSFNEFKKFPNIKLPFLEEIKFSNPEYSLFFKSFISEIKFPPIKIIFSSLPKILFVGSFYKLIISFHNLRENEEYIFKLFENFVDKNLFNNWIISGKLVQKINNSKKCVEYLISPLIEGKYEIPYLILSDLHKEINDIQIHNHQIVTVLNAAIPESNKSPIAKLEY